MPSVSGISVDPEGTRLIDHVTHIEETPTGYLLSVTIPNIMIRHKTSKKQLRSLDPGKMKHGFTIQFTLSPTFRVVHTAFFSCACFNIRSLTNEEFDCAYRDPSHSSHALVQLYVKVARGLRCAIGMPATLKESASATTEAIVLAVNTYIGEWATHHQLPLYSKVLPFQPSTEWNKSGNYTPIATPLRKDIDRHNLRRLFRFLEGNYAIRRGAKPSPFTPNESSLEHIGMVLAEALSNEQGANVISRLNFEHTALLLFAPQSSDQFREERSSIQKKIVKNIFNDSHLLSSVLGSANRLDLLVLEIVSFEHSRMHTVQATTRFATGEYYIANSTRKKFPEARHAAFQEVFRKFPFAIDLSL